MKLSTIQATLLQLGTRPTRSLGQNFLHDQNLAAWIVDQLGIQPAESWVELGAGLGALTEFAVERSSRGLLIEKDKRLVEFLRERFPLLEIVHGDAADFDVRELFARGPVKVLGNLPYYVSSQILFHFTAEPSPVAALVFTLQRELAERLAAIPRTKQYGALTLLIGRRWRVKYLRTLPPTVFMPAPKVDSAVVLLSPRNSREVSECDGVLFDTLVKRGFSQRRKQLRNLLGGESFDWPALCAELQVPATVRAEELSLDQWIAVANFAGRTSAPIDRPELAQDVHNEIFDVVDDHDVVLRQATRHDVHAGNLRHRAVHIFIFNQRDELFLQKRSRKKDRHPCLWDSSASGHVAAGQTYDETARRELLEELGVQTALEAVGALPAGVETGWEFIQLYRGRHEGPFRLPPLEIETGGFFSEPQLQRWLEARPDDFAPGFLECWRLFGARAAR